MTPEERLAAVTADPDAPYSLIDNILDGVAASGVPDSVRDTVDAAIRIVEDGS